MSIRKSIASTWDLAKSGGTSGVLLLAQPLINLIFSRQRSLDAYSAVDASALVFILYAIICFIVAFRTIENHRFLVKILFCSPLVLFVLYTAYGTLSMFWSVNLMLTGFRSFECLSMLMLIVASIGTLIESYGIKRAFQWSMLFVVSNILFSIISRLMWTTDIFVILEGSQMMATCFFYLALFWVPLRWYNYLIMLFSFFSGSTVAYIGMALGSISILWTRGKYRFYAVFAALTVVLLVCYIGPMKVLKETVFYDKKEISIEQTSGRNHIMDVAIKAIETKPQGWGFFSGEPYLLYKNNLGAINGHNSLFSAAIGTGLPGVILICAFLIAMGLAAFSQYIPSRYKAIIIGCFCVAFMHCMGNPSIGSRVYGAWMPEAYIFSLICAVCTSNKYYILSENEED